MTSADHAPGRIDRLRARAERAANRYQALAQKQPLLGLPLLFLARYTARQGVLLASAAAFRLFLWLLPLALLGAGILAAVSTSSGADIESASKAAGVTGAASQQVVSALRDGNRSWAVAVASGTVLFLWATRTLMRNLAVANAHAWAAPMQKPRQKYVLITTVMFAGAWGVVMLLTAAIHRIAHLVPAGYLLAIVVQSIAVSALWLVIMMRLPDRRQNWLDLVPGAVLFGVGLSIMNTVGRLYLPPRFAHSSAIYGSLGIASVMLLWLLLIGQLIVSAALANAVWFDFRADRRASASETRTGPAERSIEPFEVTPDG